MHLAIVIYLCTFQSALFDLAYSLQRSHESTHREFEKFLDRTTSLRGATRLHRYFL
jgi:hypothetical protein